MRAVVTLDSAPLPRTGLAVHVIEDQTVVLVPADGSLHRLDAPATLLWRLLAPGVTLRRCAADLAAATGAAPDRVEADVLDAVRRWVALGLLSLDERPAP